MSAPAKTVRGRLGRRRRDEDDDDPTPAPAPPPAARPDAGPLPAIDHAVEISPNDPLVAYFESAGGPVDVGALELDSPALADLKAAGVRMAVPLVSQGELIGVLNLGARRSEQDYSSDDRRLLDNLAAQAAPALRVGQLVREQQAGVRERERIQQELHVATLIQQNFLPKELPDLPGWRIEAHYQPAREVGGDFYDVIPLPGDRVAFVVGDVTDKGVPAALVMAATRSLLRASATRLLEPGRVLERVNDQICPDMPEKMFVTCLYGVLDPASGRLRFANAGHDLPYVKTEHGTVELRARGMPLGLMTGMHYEEKEATLAPGESLLLHSDGVVEAHSPEGEMFGFPRLKESVAEYPGGRGLIDRLLADLDSHTGPGAEQEDDITMVTLERLAARGVLADFEVHSAPGNERVALERVAAAVAPLGLSAARLNNLKTAVAEATMNAMEHGNGYRADAPVSIRVLASDADVRVQITDQGGGTEIPAAETPDLEAKLAGLQTPRGWGLFLLERMVDELEVTSDGAHRTVELAMQVRGDGSGNA